MVGEILLNISRVNEIRFKIETDKLTYIYITLDKNSSPAHIKTIPNIIHVGEITCVKDDGNEFTIITDSGKNIIELETDGPDWGYFMLWDKY